MKFIKKILLPLFLILSAQTVLADLITPPLSLVIGASVFIFIICLAVNFGINFLIMFSISKLILNKKIKKLAKGLLIITPIMLCIEIFLTMLIIPNQFMDLFFIWVLSGIVIFSCYFIMGKTIWLLKTSKTIFVALCMAVLTNPSYLLILVI